jgi:hypothetical protein
VGAVRRHGQVLNPSLQELKKGVEEADRQDALSLTSRCSLPAKRKTALRTALPFRLKCDCSACDVVMICGSGGTYDLHSLAGGCPGLCASSSARGVIEFVAVRDGDLLDNHFCLG